MVESQLANHSGARSPISVFEDEATINAWDADYYHPIAVKYYDVAIPWMLQAMGIKPGDEVLDAGCGPGVHAIRAARYGCRVTAVDISSTMLAHAQERAAAAGVAGMIKFEQADLTGLNLGRTFDYAFSWGVLIHISNVEAALDGLVSVIRPSGKLALQLLNRQSIDSKVETLARRLLRKDLSERNESQLGTGSWFDFERNRLWVMRFDTGGLSDFLLRRGLRLVGRRAAEYTELQWRARGPLRSLLLHMNAAAHRLNAPASLSATQILIFRKGPE